MSWTANIQGSYGTGSMTVSWTAPASLPNTYTVTAQPGSLTATVAGTATSATLTTTLTGVAYNVSVVANYSGSTQTATATLVSPPATLHVPLTTDVAPWLWYDAADPTTVRCNSSGVLTEWYNKGTSAGSTNGNVTISGSPNVNASINGRPAFSSGGSNKIITPSFTPTSQSCAIFFVNRVTQDIAPSTWPAFIYYNSASLPQIFFAIDGIGMRTQTANRVVTSTTVAKNTANLFSVINSGTVGNNIFAINGTGQSLIHNIASGGQTLNATTYTIGELQGDIGEVIVYMGEITTTQRIQIEGYLAWKWGLQANLPASHPFSTANMATTMAAYNRPRTYVSTFVDLTAQTGTMLLRGLARDPSGNFYTCLGDKVLKITSSGTVSTFTTAGGTTNRTDITCDASGNVYVSERWTPNSVIRKFNNDGTQVYAYLLPANNYGVYVDNSGCAFSNMDDGTVYKINPAGTSATTNPFSGARGNIAFDASNNVYILDGRDNKLYKLSPDYSTSTLIAGSGTDAVVDGIGAGASFSWFSRLLVDPSGNIFATNLNCVRIITPGGVVRTIAGSPTGAFGFTNGLDVTARFRGLFDGSLEGIVRDPINGDLYVLEHGNKAIRKISMGALHQVGSLISSGLNAPNGITTDGFGNIFMSNYNTHSIFRITPSGTISTFAGSGSSGAQNNAGISASFTYPASIEKDELGNLYVTEITGHRIRKITPAGLVTTLAGSGSAGSGDGTGTGASFNLPCCTSFGPDGNIYVGDSGNNRIRKVSRSGVVTRYAGTGAAGFDNASGNPLNATLKEPIQIVFDSSRNMYITERQNNCVRKISSDYVISTFVGGSSGQLDGNGTNAKFNIPNSIVIDSTDTMYVGDVNGATIRRVKPNGDVLTIAGTANSAGFNDAIGTSAKFSGPNYLNIDAAGNLWLCDGGNNRIRHIAINIAPAGSVSIIGTLTQGQTITANTTSLVDTDGLGTFSYVWSASPSANGVYTTIAGATGASLTLGEAQVGKYIKVAVSYTDGRGSAEAVSAVAVGTVANVNDPATGLAISGTLQRGLTISANIASLADPDGNAPPYTYQWASSTSASSGFVDISGATSSSYTLTSADVGKYIRLTVGYTNSYGAADSAVVVSGSTVLYANTPVSGSLDISGTLSEGSAVRAIANLVDPDGIGALLYTWSSSSSANGVFTVDASGQDLSGITLAFSQASRYLRVQVSYTDLCGNAENMISSVVGPIAAYPAPNAPTIGVATAGVTSATLNWSAPVSNSPIALASYAIYNASNTFIKSVDASSQSTVITDLTPGVAQRFSVIAVNSRGIAGNASALSTSVTPTAPSVAALASGTISEVINVPMSVAGVAAVAKKITPTVAADGKKEVAYNPEPGVKTTVAVAGLPAEVEKVVVATAAPQNGYTTLKIAAFDAANQSVSNFSAAPITITLNVPGYTASTLLVRTFDEIGGAQRDSTTATRNGDGSYTMTLSHLTYLRVSENVPCFVAGTKILTAVGYKIIEDIKDGELVATADGRALPCKVYITEIDETTKENAPYVIPANTFGPRCPVRDLTLSPLHAIQIRRGVWQIPKAAATIYAGVRQLPIGTSCTYYHLEMPNYLTDNIVADGTVVESYGARQLKGRRVEYKFDDVVGGFTRTITEARARGVAVKRA